MSKGGNSDVLMLGALAVGAYMVLRSRTVMAAPRTVTQPRTVLGGLSNGGLFPSAGAVRNVTGSPDVVASGGYSNGSTGSFFSDITSYDNANAAVASQISADLMLGGGAVPVNYDWSQWNSRNTSQFTLPDLTNSNQNAYGGFDNPANYG
ncbi:hypothetical protein E2553_33180 [Paraburkholderia dipogonis]|uniref:Uncharacterized protein n=1 Tax=Paraburkholderia dipogonis TaxID=1211383 RepID=A0A4Y8MVU8_9BURK|nr:hypothetical protein [Paraburkholderia dipogonis]TFE41518.1 hypothetical protein E2553_33180 [Paraburkholderia dipogonis]